MSEIVAKVGKLLQETQSAVNSTWNGLQDLKNNVADSLRSLRASVESGEAVRREIHAQEQEKRAFLSEITLQQERTLQEQDRAETSGFSLAQEPWLNMRLLITDHLDTPVKLYLPDYAADNIGSERTPEPVSPPIANTYEQQWEEVSAKVLIFTDEYVKQILSLEVEQEEGLSPPTEELPIKKPMPNENLLTGKREENA